MPRLALLRNSIMGGGAPAPPPVLLPKAKHVIELELTGVGGGWTDVSCDVRDSSLVTCEYGIQGNEPGDVIASTGTFSFDLDNGFLNPIGWHSPLHPDRRPGFNLNIGVRYSVGADPSGTRYYKFKGKLAIAEPTIGIHGELFTACVARDIWDDFARTPMPDLLIQTQQRSDQLISTILNTLTLAQQPLSRTIETGLETFTYAFDGGMGQQLTIREAITQICLSETGRAYTRGDTLWGDRFVFENRTHRTANPPTLFTIADTMTGVLDVVVPGSRDDIYGTVRVIVHPTLVDSVPVRVVYALNGSTLRIPAGATITTVFGTWTDITNNNLIGVIDAIPPAASTSPPIDDYRFNAAADGTGTDLTASLTVVPTFTGQGVRFTLTNTSGSDGYVTKLEVRGRAIFRFFQPIEERIIGAYGDKVYEYDMPFQSSVNAGADILEHFVSIFSTPFANVQSVTFCATASQALFDAMLQREPGDRIVLSEQVSGVESQPFTINRVRTEGDGGGNVWCTWGLEQASAQQFWMIGIPGVSEIGTTTTVGF